MGLEGLQQGMEFLGYVGIFVIIVNVVLSVLFWLMVWRVYKYIPTISCTLDSIEENQRRLLKRERVGNTGRIR